MGTRRPRLLRLRRRPTPYWLAAAVLAVVTGGFVATTAARAEQALASYGDSTHVVVATRDLAAGSTIRAGDVAMRRLPVVMVPEGALTAAPAGEVTRVALYAGEVVLESRLAPAGLSGVAALLPPGARGIAVPTDPAAGLELDVGDAVDVLVTMDPASSAGEPAIVVAHAAPVVAVGEASVTVAVTRSEAPRLAFALTQGVVTLALVGG